MSEVFDGLKGRLEELEWPSVYLFKFVCPSDNEIIALVSSHFDDGSEFSFNSSRNGKYTSVSVKEVMLNAEAVIAIYEDIAKIKGVISL